MKVHSTAVVEPGASLGVGVEIGPFAVIGSSAVIGDGTIIGSHVVLEGSVFLGKNNSIGSGSIVGGAPQDLGFKPETSSRVEIGDGNVFREHCTIHRGTEEGSATQVGDGNFFMAGAHLGHNARVGGWRGHRE